MRTERGGGGGSAGGFMGVVVFMSKSVVDACGTPIVYGWLGNDTIFVRKVRTRRRTRRTKRTSVGCLLCICECQPGALGIGTSRRQTSREDGGNTGGEKKKKKNKMVEGRLTTSCSCR